MEGSHAVRIAPASAERERLAKDWVLGLVDRTPLPELADLPLRRLATETPALIAAIFAALAAPEPDPELDLAAADRARDVGLSRLRSGTGAPVRIGRDLGELQAVIVGHVGGELGRDSPALAPAAARLAGIFGSIQGGLAAELVGELRSEPEDDPVTGLPGSARLDRRLATLLAEQRRYGYPFSLALIDVDGLARINDAYGREAGDRMLRAVTAILRRQLRDADGAYRLEDDELAIVAPHTDTEGLAAMARRVAGLISSSQLPEGPRIAIAAGVVGCPADGLNGERLLESAAEATYAAKASGAAVARSATDEVGFMQDP